MSYERKWLDEAGSEDCNGRIIFVLGYIIKNTPSYSILSMIKNLFDKSVKIWIHLNHPFFIIYCAGMCTLFE